MDLVFSFLKEAALVVVKITATAFAHGVIRRIKERTAPIGTRDGSGTVK
jgi:hypothetical protein